MATTTISLPDDDLMRLQQHAQRSGRTLDEIMREAVDSYLADVRQASTPRILQPYPGPPTPEWQADIDAALARVHARAPKQMTPAQIEAEITLASDEALQERIDQRARARRA